MYYLKFILIKIFPIIPVIIFSFLLLTCNKDSPIQPNPTVVKSLLMGTVEDQSSRYPISGAVVRALKNKMADTTDTFGAFRFDSLSAGIDTFMIFAEGCPDTQYTEIVILANSQQVTFLLDCFRENLNLYVGASGGHDLYIVDADRHLKVDSLYSPVGDIGLFMTTTPGGSKLYIMPYDEGDHLYYLDTKTRTFHQTNLPRGTIYFNFDGEGFLFGEEGIFSVDTLNDAATQIDTITSIACVAFSPISPVLYFAKNAILYTYDYQRRTIVDSLLAPVWNMAVTPDGNELYFIGRYLGVVDLLDGTVSSILGVNDSASIGLSSDNDIGITPDGQYVLVTEPGFHFTILPPPSGLIRIVRTSDHKLEGYIDVNPVAGENNSTNRIVITSSGNYAFVNNGQGKVFVIDLSDRRVLKALEFWPASAQIIPMVLGPKIKP